MSTSTSPLASAVTQPEMGSLRDLVAHIVLRGDHIVAAAGPITSTIGIEPEVLAAKPFTSFFQHLDGPDLAALGAGSATHPTMVLVPASRRALEARSTRQADGTVVMSFIDRTKLLTSGGHGSQTGTPSRERDKLTGLPSRAAISDFIASALTAGDLTGQHTAVLLVDIDDFGAINETHGLQLGNEVLTSFGERIGAPLRAGDVVGRIGRDDFVIVLPSVASVEAAGIVAKRISESARVPIEVGGTTLHLTASIGFAVGKGPQSEPEALIQAADAAAHRAKQSGPGEIASDTSELDQVSQTRRKIERDLDAAFGSGQFELHYQSIHEAGLPQPILSTEAFVRWQHPTWGLLTPDHFVPIAEETGRILTLSRDVIEQACRDLAHWEPLGPASVSINLSGGVIADRRLIAHIRDTLDRYGLSGKSLIIEITEAAVMEASTDVIANLEALRKEGVRIMLDDFGTGYSNISTLSQLPVDGVKIDRSFIDPVLDHELVSLIVSIAKQRRLIVCAEGVETEEQLAQLGALGVDQVQGFLLSRPAPYEHE